MFHKLLIANRGEIACRIIKTARRMGIETVAVYSTADRDSLHVSLADFAFCIGPPPSKDSYLNIETVIATALTCGADAIHPGYGFLSENPKMAEACHHAGIVFVGPPVAAIKAMASKQLAKQLLEKTDVPLTPGYHGAAQTDDALLHEAKRLGFPVLLKAARGGGGKGMRAVLNEADFFNALAGAKREAKSSFSDDTMLIEKLIQNPRHVEIQLIADNHGNVIHLFERDCSIQRRHQKIIEEAPAPNLPEELRASLAVAAIAVARAIDYKGAGTVEFLVDKNHHFYFMEMNTRLQVEHPVTEMITGLDLVEWQLRIAANEPLPCRQEDIKKQGHAIECRIYAEDPLNGFMPSMGQLDFLKEPSGSNLRLDTGVTLNSHITIHYDPMIAKLIAWGETREEAIQRLKSALSHYHIGGVKTNIAHLQEIIQDPHFIKGQLSTDFLNLHQITFKPQEPYLALLFAASYDYLALWHAQKDSLLRDTFAWQMHLSSHWTSCYMISEELYSVLVTPIGPNDLTLTIDKNAYRLKVTMKEDLLTLEDGQQLRTAWVGQKTQQMTFYTAQGPITVQRSFAATETHALSSANHQLTAPMPSTVVAVLKNKGDHILKGEPLMVLEAMKMEHTIHAPRDGEIQDVFYDIGAQVNEGSLLLSLVGST